MRESLTILAVAVIVLLSALLVGPYLVDWGNQRDFLAAKLSKAVGAKVRIDGAIDVKLLPRPIFRVGQVSIEGAGPADPRVMVKTLDAELSINGLLQGAVEFLDATVMSPRLEITMRSDGSLIAAPVPMHKAPSFQFKHVNVSDGVIVVRDEAGADLLSIGGISAQGEADSLVGPLKSSGTIQQGDRRVAFRLNTGAFAANRLRIKLVLDGGEALSRVDADGFLTFVPPATGGHEVPGFEGAFNLAGALHVADGAALVPWRMAVSGVKTDRQAITATTVELRAGADGRALVANGGGFLDLGLARVAVLQLRARQLDLDRLAVPPDVAPDTPRPTAAQWIAALKHFAGVGGGLSMPIAVSANFGVDAITSNDLTLTDAAVVFDGKPGAPVVGRLSIAGPEGTRLALDGTFEAGAAPAFKGHAEFATRSVPSAVGWFGPLWPEAADAIGSDPAVKAIDFTGEVAASPGGVAASGMRLSLDGATLGGSLALTSGAAGERPRLVGDLTADRLDGGNLPKLSSFAAAAVPLDVSLGLASQSARFAGGGTAPIDAGQLALHITKTGDDVTLDQFSVTGFGGAAVTATAAIDAAKHLRTEGRIEAKAVAPLAGVLRQIMPDAVTEMLSTHASSISPLNLDFKAEGTLDADFGFNPTIASGEGSVGAVRVTASFTPESAQKFGTPIVNMVVNLAAADAGAVLRQWGIAGAGQLGAGQADIVARGTLKDGFDASATLKLSEATAAFDGRLGLANGSGHLKTGGTSAANLLQTTGLMPSATSSSAGTWDAAGDVAWGEGRVSIGKLLGHFGGSSVAGAVELRNSPPALDAPPTQVVTGLLMIDETSLRSLWGLALVLPAQGGTRPAEIWQKAKFGSMASLPRSEIALKVGTLDLLPGLSARDAALTLRIAPGSVTLANMTGRLLSGTAAGTVTLRRDGPAASLSGQISLAAVPFELPSLAGRLSTTLDLASTGSSPDALIASLAGEGVVAIAGTRMPRLDPDALNRIAKGFDADGIEVEDATVRDALGGALDKGAIALGELSAPATVAAGTLRVMGLQTRAPGYTATSEGALDLRDLELTARTTVTTAQVPKDWKGDPPQVTVTWSGPLGAPNRNIDAAAFVNGLAARAIARDQERIELIQDDIRERAFFARRLRQIEAEQQAVRDAAQIQKMVPTPPRPGDIRIPKQTEGALPGAPPAARAQTGRNTPGGDDISKFLNSLEPIAAPSLKPAGSPLQLQPASPGGKSPAASGQ